MNESRSEGATRAASRERRFVTIFLIVVVGITVGLLVTGKIQVLGIFLGLVAVASVALILGLTLFGEVL
jgi:hypothetical protein